MTLTEDFVLKKSKSEKLSSVTVLNLYGKKLVDVSLVQRMTNLESVTLSANSVNSLEHFKYCTKLKELFLRKNNISGLDQLKYLKNLKFLQTLWLSDNPIVNEPNYRLCAIHTIPQLLKLDQLPIGDKEREDARKLFEIVSKKPAANNRVDVNEQNEAAFRAVMTLLPALPKDILQDLYKSL